VSKEKMARTLRSFGVLFLLFVVTMVGHRGEEVKNGTSHHTQGNATLATLSHQGENHELKGKHNASSNEVLFNTSKDSWYYKGGGGWWKWGCGGEARHGKGKHRHHHTSNKEEYRIGEFAQCMARTRCHGMRLDCPLHCGGPCFYDCLHMCKSHCRRP